MLPDLRKQETILHILQSVDQVPRLYCTVLHTVLYTVLHTVQVARLADHIADTVDQRCDQFMARLQGISQVGIPHSYSTSAALTGGLCFGISGNIAINVDAF